MEGGRASPDAGGQPQREGTAAEQAPIDALYKRLPHGPHRLARSEVARHQRARLHGAMVQAVAEHGYQRTSVKHVIGLAGVSRRSFYEQFDNKQDCLLATFDVLMRDGLARMQAAYGASTGGLEDRLRATFCALASAVAQSPPAARLVLLETQTTGPQGTLRLRRASTAWEHLLAASFAPSSEAGALPRPIARAIAGGLHAAISASVRDGVAIDAEALLSWTLSFSAAPEACLRERLIACVQLRGRALALAAARRRASATPVEERAAPAAHDERRRLLESALRLAGRHDYHGLTMPQIADEADVPIDTCLELFDDRDACFLAALEMIGEELGTIARSASPWPQGVVAAVEALMRHLAGHPFHARAIAQEAFFAGDAASRSAISISRVIAELLTHGAPAAARDAVTIEAVAGAIVHSIRCQVAGGRVELLPALSDPLAVAVLAPFLGAQAALDVVCPTRGR